MSFMVFLFTQPAQVRAAGAITNTKTQVSLIAKAVGVSPSLALNIACAESQFKPAAKNPYSSAGGVFQFLNGTWRTYALKYYGTSIGYDKLDPSDNIMLAMLVIKKKGTSDWNASKYTGLGGGWANHPYENGYCGKAFIA